jgi:hypothetical protein
MRDTRLFILAALFSRQHQTALHDSHGHRRINIEARLNQPMPLQINLPNSGSLWRVLPQLIEVISLPHFP